MATIISVGMNDAAGKRRTFPVWVQDGYTVAQLQTFINNFVPLLDAVIGAQILDVSVGYTMTVPGGLKGSPDAGSEVRQGALLSYDATGTPYRFSLFVPTWDEAGYTADVVNNTGAYATFITNLLNGDGTVLPCDKYDNDLSAYLGGEQTFRKV